MMVNQNTTTMLSLEIKIIFLMSIITLIRLREGLHFFGVLFHIARHCLRIVAPKIKGLGSPLFSRTFKFKEEEVVEDP